jgi:thiol-disulfide isomerase/thioredoxin
MKAPRWLLAATLLLAAGSAAAQGFVFKDLQGQTQRLSDYRGKWVLVNFWATWCPPCLEEVPDLVALHEAHKKTDLVVIGVALDSSRESVVEFVAKRHVSYPVVMGDYELAEQVGEVNALPTSYLFDPSGKLLSYQEGMVTRESVESYIKSRSKQQK